MLLNDAQQQPCSKVVMARVRRLRLAQGQARQTKSNKENRYVIKVMRLNTEGDAVSLVININKSLLFYLNVCDFGPSVLLTSKTIY